MKILVTGAAGHIGAATLSSLINQGHEAIGIDSFTNYYSPAYKEARIASFGISSKITNLDLADYKKLSLLLEVFKPQKIIHLAARPGVRADWNKLNEYIVNNIQGFQNLIQASKLTEVKQIIYASSSSVYGDDCQPPLKEEMKLSAPKSFYALSKLSNEIAAKLAADQKMKFTGLRFFTVYGPWGRPDMAILQFLVSAMSGEKANLTGDLSTKRDFTYIDDVVEFISKLSDKDQVEVNEVYNVGGGRPRSLSEMIEIFRTLGVDIKLQNGEISTLDVKITDASNLKLVGAGLPTPKIPLEIGLKRVLNWSMSQKLDSLITWIPKNK